MPLVAFLRGLNVGGYRNFRPAALARELRHLGIVNIGAAGTLVVREPITRAALRAEIEQRLPFEAAITICDGREIVTLASRDYFTGYPLRADIVRFASVLPHVKAAAPGAPFQLPPRGRWLVKVLAREGRFLVGVYRREMKVIGHLGALDRLCGVPLTTRNWNTIAAIVKVLSAT
jgi:uncharacterized protein (DUF1697 family)